MTFLPLVAGESSSLPLAIGGELRCGQAQLYSSGLLKINDDDGGCIDHEADDLITLPLERPEMEGVMCAELFCMSFGYYGGQDRAYFLNE